MLELTRWMASRYYACSWGQALDSVVPAGVKKGAGTRSSETFLTVVPTRPVKLEAARTWSCPPKQAEALAVLCRTKTSELPLTVDDACRLANCAAGPIAALEAEGAGPHRPPRTDKPLKNEPPKEAEARALAPLPRVLTGRAEAALDAMAPAWTRRLRGVSSCTG